jgi:hypothetical protein
MLLKKRLAMRIMRSAIRIAEASIVVSNKS